MSWAPIQHSLLTHQKVARAGTEAAWWWVCAILYADLNATDGFIAAELAGEIAPNVRGKAGERAAARCLDVGLLDAAPTPGWLIHDYAEHQRPGAEVKASREAARRRQRNRRANGTNGARDA